MKKFLGFVILLISSSFILYFPGKTLTVLDAPRQIVQQQVERKQAAILKKKNSQMEIEQLVMDDISIIPRVNAWRTTFEKLDTRCRKNSEEYFADKNYIDVQEKHYKNIDEMLIKLSLVFKNTLQRKEGLGFFEEMIAVADNCNDKKINLYNSVFNEVEVCRTYESFYYVETVFEALKLYSFTDEQKNSVFEKIIKLTSSLLNDQATIENSLYVLSILKQLPRNINKDKNELVLDKVNDYYEQIFELWRDYKSSSLELRENEQCSYFKDYFSDVEFINIRIREFINDLN